MAERDLIEQLDEAIDVIVAGGARAPIDPSLALLALVAEELRGLPDPHFRANLKGTLIPMTAAELKVPPGFLTMTPYLAGDGAARLIAFLESAFGAVVEMRVSRPEDPERIAHSQIRIGDALLELGDVVDPADARRFELHLYVDDADATYQRAIEAGARSLHAPVDQPYGDREAGIEDPLGNYWYIATHGTEIRPEGFHAVTPFLHARDAAALSDFLLNVFGARTASRDESPEGTIQHGVLFIGDAPIEVASAHGKWQPMPAALHVFVPDADITYERALAAGAESLFPPRTEAYGQRIAGITDAEGNRWYLATVLG